MFTFSLPLASLLAAAIQVSAPLGEPTDPIYETPALEALVARAAAANRRLPPGVTSYGARVETEISFVRLEADGRETLIQLEQVASDLWWRSDGGLSMDFVGYRAQMLGASFSGLSFFDVPWVVPTLYGERLDLVRTGGPEYAPDGTLLVRRALHPFSAARESVYRFAGGDTVLTLRLPDRTVPIVRIQVTPERMPERPTLLFHGHVDVDVTRMHIVGMQGRLFVSGQARSFLDVFAQGALFVDFESAEYDEAYWLPREQRFEAQAISRLGEGRVVFRVVSRFVDVRPNDPEAERRAAAPGAFPLGVLAGGEDPGRLAGFDAWRMPMGELSARADARAFDAYGPPGLAPTGSPRLVFGARHLSQLFRLNKVEGVFTGVGLLYDLGDAAPGLLMRGHAGWAWREGTARGGLEVQQRVGEWELLARAERQIAHTHDFLLAMDPEPDVAPIVGAEDFTWVDRRVGGLLARSVRQEGLAWRLDLSRVADRAAGGKALLGDPNGPADPAAPLASPVAPGSYWRTRAELRQSPSAGGISLNPGLFLRLAAEAAVGELEWQKLEAGTALRRRTGRWTVSLRGDAGIVVSPEPPPQALFELGSLADTPGFVDRTFAGDRAALGRGTLMYTLPLLGAPLRLGAMWLPAPAPSPSVGLHFAWTDASASAARVMEPLAWRTSEGVRAALDLRLRFFGGAVSAGAARALERDGRWRFVWSLVGGF